MASTLGKLSRERPSVQDIDEAMEELKTDGARGAVALGSALIEDVLQACITLSMVRLTSSEIDELFTGQSPIASFSARVRLAYALGIFGRKTRKDLNTVREIRNAVVHAKRRFTFDTQAVKYAVDNMNCIKSKPGINDLSTQHRFAKAVFKLLVLLSGYIASKENPSTSNMVSDEFSDTVLGLD